MGTSQVVVRFEKSSFFVRKIHTRHLQDTLYKPHFHFMEGLVWFFFINTLHIMLLDVMMDGMNGMKLAEELRKQHNNMTIIFISVNREMGLCGYEISAARYLGKSLDENKMKETLLYGCHSLSKPSSMLVVVGGKYKVASIAFISRSCRFFDCS